MNRIYKRYYGQWFWWSGSSSVDARTDASLKVVKDDSRRDEWRDIRVIRVFDSVLRLTRAYHGKRQSAQCRDLFFKLGCGYCQLPAMSVRNKFRKNLDTRRVLVVSWTSNNWIW